LLAAFTGNFANFAYRKAQVNTAVKKAIVKLLSIILVFVAFGALQKLLFMTIYHDVIADVSIADYASVVWHGLPMDFSIAGYLTLIPAFLITAQLWTARRWADIALRTWLAIASVALAAITCIDLTLYGYWGFRLDMTPLFYFTTSPAAAMASASWWQIAGGIAGIAALASMLYLSFTFTALRIDVFCPTKPKPIAATTAMLLLTAGLIIPIRGGVTVSTMNLSRSYFSPNARLNHAAINPAFSLMYSATHQTDFDNEYRVMTDEEAASALSRLAGVTSDSIAPTGHNNENGYTLLKEKRPDIWLVILESFSAHLMPSLGGENIAPGLDSIAHSGVLFTNFYANSFRTDRALPAILGGFPAQPSMSLMKYVEKTEHLPTLPGELKKAGYETSYYYGGDINFTNMKAYLVNAGFEKIVCDADFPLSERTGKWGAHDHLVFDRALSDARASSASIPQSPQFRVIQTSSSHEPFEVPYSNVHFADHAQKNAFAYTDSCLSAFVDRLKALPGYAKSLIVIVPDHLGAWPLDLPDAFERHHIPLVLTGGALATRNERIATPASQIDITATLLGQLGLDASMFEYSKDLMDTNVPHFALFTESSLIGIAMPGDTAVYNCDARTMEKLTGPNAEPLGNAAKAYLQHIYHTIATL